MTFHVGYDGRWRLSMSRGNGQMPAACTAGRGCSCAKLVGHGVPWEECSPRPNGDLRQCYIVVQVDGIDKDRKVYRNTFFAELSREALDRTVLQVLPCLVKVLLHPATNTNLDCSVRCTALESFVRVMKRGGFSSGAECGCSYDIVCKECKKVCFEHRFVWQPRFTWRYPLWFDHWWKGVTVAAGPDFLRCGGEMRLR
jgi:hypothetical protein